MFNLWGSNNNNDNQNQDNNNQQQQQQQQINIKYDLMNKIDFNLWSKAFDLNETQIQEVKNTLELDGDRINEKVAKLDGPILKALLTTNIAIIAATKEHHMYDYNLNDSTDIADWIIKYKINREKLKQIMEAIGRNDFINENQEIIDACKAIDIDIVVENIAEIKEELYDSEVESNNNENESNNSCDHENDDDILDGMDSVTIGRGRNESKKYKEKTDKEERNGKSDENDDEQMDDDFEIDDEKLDFEKMEIDEIDDYFYEMKKTIMMEGDNVRDKLIALLPSDPEFLENVKNDNEEDYNNMLAAIAQWELKTGTKLNWDALGIKNRISVGSIMEDIGKENPNTIISNINSKNITRMDFGKTRIEFGLKAMWRIDEDWNVTMEKELLDEETILIHEIVSAKIIKKNFKGKKKGNKKEKVNKKEKRYSDKKIVLSEIPPELTTDSNGKLLDKKIIDKNIKEFMVNIGFKEDDIIMIIFRENKFNKIDKKDVKHRATVILDEYFNVAQFETKATLSGIFNTLTIERQKSFIYRKHIKIHKPGALVTQCDKCHQFGHFTHECGFYRYKKDQLKQELEKQNATQEVIKDKLKKFKLPTICFKCGDKDNPHMAKDCKNKSKCINCHGDDHNAKEFGKCNKFHDMAHRIEKFLIVKYGESYETKWLKIIQDYPMGLRLCDITSRDKMIQMNLEKKKRKREFSLLKLQNEYLERHNNYIRNKDKKDEVMHEKESELENKEKESEKENRNMDKHSDEIESVNGNDDEKEETTETHNGRYVDTMAYPKQSDVLDEASVTTTNKNVDRKSRKRKRSEFNEEKERDSENEAHQERVKERHEKLKAIQKTNILKKIKKTDQFAIQLEKQKKLREEHAKLMKQQSNQFEIKDNGQSVERSKQSTEKQHSHSLNKNMNGDTPSYGSNYNEKENENNNRNKDKRRKSISNYRKRKHRISLLGRIKDSKGVIIQYGSINYDRNNIGKMENEKVLEEKRKKEEKEKQNSNDDSGGNL